MARQKEIFHTALIHDKNNPGRPDQDLPDSLHGAVILEVDELGGIVSADYETVQMYKELTDEELEITGWIRYKKVLDSLPATNPVKDIAPVDISEHKAKLIEGLAKRKAERAQGGNPNT